MTTTVHKIGWTLSRYWNWLAFKVIKLGISMIWDYTERNGDLIRDLWSEDTKEILTYNKWYRGK